MLQSHAKAQGAHTLTRGVFMYALASATVILLAFPNLALAYVDPSVVTYAVQAIAGVAVAVSAVIGVAFRKVRTRVFSLLGIDPAAHKERDGEYRTFDEHDAAMGMTPEEAFKHAGGDPEKLSNTHRPRSRQGVGSGSHRAVEKESFAEGWRSRIGYAFVVSLFAFGTLLIVAPLEIVAGSADDFFFTPNDIAANLMPFSILIVCLIAIALSLLQGVAYRYVLAVLFAVGVCFYLQAMVMNAGLPIADGKTVNWENYDPIAIGTAIVWVAIITGMVLLARFRVRIARGVCVFVSAALILVQGVGVIAMVSGASFIDAQPDSTKVVSSEEGMMDLSSRNNVVVFVLDTFDTAYLIKDLEAYPGLLDEFTGFTWYRNVVGSFVPTRMALPYMLTGVKPDKDKPWEDWLRNRYQRSTFLSDIQAAGYNTGIYTNTMRLDYVKDTEFLKTTIDRTINLTFAGDIVEMDIPMAYGALVQCACYRDFPWVLKPRFRFTTPEVKAAMVHENNTYIPGKTTYYYDDVAYYEKLKDNGLSLEDRGSKGSFRFIHLNGAHLPYTIDEYGREVGETSVTQQSVGSLRMVEYYLKEMKRLGVYDDATIIVTADHGRWYQTNMYDIGVAVSPLMLAKPSQTTEEASMPWQESYAPVEHGDIVPTIISAVGKPTYRYEGKSLFDYDGTEDPYRERYYYGTIEHPDDTRNCDIQEWMITGYVMDFENWQKTGFMYDADIRNLD